MANELIGLNLKEGSSLSTIGGVSTSRVGLMGNFEWGELNKAVEVGNLADFYKKYGSEAPLGTTSFQSVKGFFAKLGSGSLWIVRCASATAAKATSTLQDRNGSPANTARIDAKYHGSRGNHISRQIADYNILSTTLLANISGGATSARLTSIGGLEVGSDISLYNGTNTEERRIISIDITNNQVNWTTGLTNAYTTANGVIKSLEFSLLVYFKGILVETFNGLSANNSVSFFAEKKINGVSDYVTYTDLKATDTDNKDRPAVIAAAVLASGADGLSDVVANDYKGVQASKSGKYAFDSVEGLFRICCPNPKLTDGSAEVAYKGLIQDLLDYCNTRKTIELYADFPTGKSVADAATFASGFEGRLLTFFYPWGIVRDKGIDTAVPPSSIVLGAAVEKDIRRGVHKNIGNESIPFFTDLVYNVSTTERETLAASGVNVIQKFSGRGIRTYGGRTRSSEGRWLYIHYSELFNYLANSLMISLADVPFEPNDELLWKTTKRRIESFLDSEQRKGSLYDPTNPNSAAYIVNTGNPPNTSQEVTNGVFTIQVEYVPVGTAEKVVIELTSSPSGLTITNVN